MERSNDEEYGREMDYTERINSMKNSGWYYNDNNIKNNKKQQRS